MTRVAPGIIIAVYGALKSPQLINPIKLRLVWNNGIKSSNFSFLTFEAAKVETM